jgi:hypothetical protein
MHRTTQSHGIQIVCVLVIIGLLFTATMAVADFREYPEYRFSSGLPGNNAAVGPGGTVGIEGAAQMTIPVAYTPSEGTLALDANVGMQNEGITLAYKGEEANGTFNFAFGFLEPGHGLYAAYMCTSEDGEPAINFQYQLRPEDDKGPALAVGVLDSVNQRTSDRKKPFQGDARSFYLVATKQLDTGDRPLFGTLGYGSDRFGDGPFAGLCYRATDRLSLSAEYDGLGANACFNYALKEPGSEENFILFGGSADMDRWSYGITYTSN